MQLQGKKTVRQELNFIFQYSDVIKFLWQTSWKVKKTKWTVIYFSAVQMYRLPGCKGDLEVKRTARICEELKGVQCACRDAGKIFRRFFFLLKFSPCQNEMHSEEPLYIFFYKNTHFLFTIFPL